MPKLWIFKTGTNSEKKTILVLIFPIIFNIIDIIWSSAFTFFHYFTIINFKQAEKL